MMETYIFLILGSLLCLTAAASTNIPLISDDLNSEKQGIVGCKNSSESNAGHISRKDEEMVNIVRGLDQLADDLSEEEADLLDDLLDPNKQCKKQHNKREKRDCDGGCSIKCRYGRKGRIQKSCSNVGSCCDSYCYCSWFRRRANCLCYD